MYACLLVGYRFLYETIDCFIFVLKYLSIENTSVLIPLSKHPIECNKVSRQFDLR